MGHDPMARKGAGKCIHVHFLLCVHRRRSDPQSVSSTSESPSPAAASLLPSAADDLCRIHIHVDASLWVYIIHVRGCGREAPRRRAGEIPRRDPSVCRRARSPWLVCVVPCEPASSLGTAAASTTLCRRLDCLRAGLLPLQAARVGSGGASLEI